jgi:superfamily II DNA helicase RecQ
MSSAADGQVPQDPPLQQPYCTSSTDVASITSDSNYQAAVERVNTVVAYFRSKLSNYPSSFPDNTQHACMVRMSMGLDVSLSFRTGGGKTLLMLHGPLVAVGNTGVVTVVGPLTTLNKQLHKEFILFGFSKHRVHILTRDTIETIIAQIREIGRDGDPIIIVGHPEDFLDIFIPALDIKLRSRHSMSMIDEAELIIDWGDDFRVKYSQLKALGALSANSRMFTTSGSTNLEESEMIVKNLGLPSDTIMRGPMDRRDLQINVLDSAGGLPPRIVDDLILASSKGVSDKFIHSLFDTMNKHPTKIFAVYCETREQCQIFSLKLNNFFEEQCSPAQSLPFYRHHPDWMQETLNRFQDSNFIKSPW